MNKHISVMNKHNLSIADHPTISLDRRQPQTVVSCQKLLKTCQKLLKTAEIMQKLLKTAENVEQR